jgi:hypothetical protein
MERIHTSREVQPSRPPSRTEVLTRPDGVKVVELRTATDTISFILRGTDPIITMTTGTDKFENSQKKTKYLSGALSVLSSVTPKKLGMGLLHI